MTLPLASTVIILIQYSHSVDSQRGPHLRNTSWPTHSRNTLPRVRRARSALLRRSGPFRFSSVASWVWREQIIGRTLGASREADLYFASFTLPDFLNYLLAAGALSIVFIPIFLEYLQRGDDDRGWEAF